MASSLFGPKVVQPQATNNQEVAPSRIDGIRNLMTMMRSGGNSRKMAEEMLSRNPAYQNVMAIVNQHGGDAKAAFYAEAEKRGVDPNTILSMLR